MQSTFIKVQIILLMIKNTVQVLFLDLLYAEALEIKPGLTFLVPCGNVEKYFLVVGLKQNFLFIIDLAYTLHLDSLDVFN